MSNFNKKSYVLLTTVAVYVTDYCGNEHTYHALLDCGSQSNFVSTQLVNDLKLMQTETNVCVSGLNNSFSHIFKKCDVRIKSIHNNFTANIPCFVTPKITGDLPSNNIDITSWNIPTDVPLADKEFHISKRIDLLIGASLFWRIIRNHKIHLGKHLPVLQETALEYVVTGNVNVPSVQTYCNFQRDLTLHNELQNFWLLEDCSSKYAQCEDDIQCEAIFKNSISQDSNGRFIVPLKLAPNMLGDSKTTAIKRFLNLEHKFAKHPVLKEQYVNFMNEYLQLGHMSLVNDTNDAQFAYYLPHHAVFHDDSLTTKIRVVFDGSAVTDTGKSLNDFQFTGPSIQNDLFSILIRFREHNYVVCSDIAKMYRQILIYPDDRDLHRIVWRDNPSDDLKTYRLNTVTYGTASAPYLAIRCIRKLADDYKFKLPVASTIIRRDFYVDDLITGFATEIETITVCNQINKILNSACFELRKWSSNSQTILSNLQTDDTPMSVLNLTENGQIKTLGIQWDIYPDLLTYSISINSDKLISKRLILSSIARIFDPLGLLIPCISFAKVLMQELWIKDVGWDDAVPNNVHIKWIRFQDNLICLNQVKLPRHAILKNTVKVELHGFCDASQIAYGACVYMRSVDENNTVKVALLCSKSKVAPLKPITIPKLELCSALLLSRLVKTVTKALTIQPKCYLWSDSLVTLHWINTEPYKLQTFVGDRTGEIQELTSMYEWNHVDGKENPADLVSRGLYPDELLSAELWWHGPSWLHNFDAAMHKTIFIPSISIPEMKKQFVSSVVEHNGNNFDLFERFSKLPKLQRVTAYCLRFIYNSKVTKEKRLPGILKLEEIETALRKLVRLSQLESFPEEIQLLQKNGQLNSNKRLQALTPFLDLNNLVRVGGRLQNSELDYDAKHPMLLNGKHRLTRLIFEHEHSKLLHAGLQLLLSSIRQTYCPTNGMSLTKLTVRQCIRCFKFKPRASAPLMGDFPEARVSAMVPFYTTGVDYGGPFLIKDRIGRGNKVTKAYICLFVCFAVKAVHLELVTDLSTNNFISALRRFISRRGIPKDIWSDNGKNFIGAARSLSDLKIFFDNSKDEIVRSCVNLNINWHFIPPTSPHFGGLWESAIKSVKKHLLTIVGESRLTYEDFQTILVQVEGILNSRPLFPCSSDPNDPMPLTPAHFLIGKPLVMLPDANVLQVPVNRLSRYQLLQQIIQGFWKRWSSIYLSYLQQRNRWSQHATPIALGILVLLKNDNTPPYQWLLGKVTETHPGRDGVIRVVTVQTSRGSFKRAVTKICPLPMPETSASE